jgi:SNF2 family DNA or RNA helicase
MLRRLKQDRLPEIAQPNEIIVKRAMPQPQRDAYLRAIALAKAAKSESRSGGVLSALHELRKCSLHPQREDELSDDAFIEASARLQVLFDVLDKVAAVKEKALIFLNDLDMQAKLVGIIQRRYKMAVPPLVINGAVPAKQRQERVDQFQAGPEEFDAMILSPQAGGVGLTLTRANHVIHLASSISAVLGGSSISPTSGRKLAMHSLISSSS